MKKILGVFAVSFGFSAFASQVPFQCRLDSNPKVLVSGVLSENSASVRIADKIEYLGIKELDPRKSMELTRLERKRESKYKFAKYYVDVNAWQDLDMSFPKQMNSRNFPAYLTVYRDDGNTMVPGDSNKLSCILK